MGNKASSGPCSCGFFEMCSPDPFKAVAPVGISPYYVNRRALVIGIDYRTSAPSSNAKGRSTSQPTSTAVSDARNMKAFLMQMGFPEQSICLLTDDARHEQDLPTKARILDSMTWLIDDIKGGDSLFFYYAGRGTQVEDEDGDEDDGMDDAICPMDYLTAGPILDDELFTQMIKPLPWYVRFNAVMDCVGSVAALDFSFGMHGSDVARQHKLKKMMEAGGAKARKADRLAKSGKRQNTALIPLRSKIKRAQCDAMLFSSCPMSEEDRAAMKLAQAQGGRGAPKAMENDDEDDDHEEDSGMLGMVPGLGAVTGFVGAGVGALGTGLGALGSLVFEDNVKRGFSDVKYDEDGTIRLGTFCDSCDDPTTKYCKESGKLHDAHRTGSSGRLSGRVGGALTTAFTELYGSAKTRGEPITVERMTAGIHDTLARLQFNHDVQISGTKPFRMTSVVDF